MESMVSFFNQNPYMSLISFLVGVSGVLLTVVFFAIGIKYKRLSYIKKTNNLVSLKNVAVDSLHLFFNKEEISDVSITRIAVWNSGNETIGKIDVVENEPLRVYVREGHEDTTRILDCSIVYETDKSNFGKYNPKEFRITDNNYEIPFDFMAKADGMIIQVIHTGESDDIYMDCHIKGGKDTTQVSYDGLKQKKSLKEIFIILGRGVFYLLFQAVFLSIILAIIIWFIGYDNIGEYEVFLILSLMVLFFTLIMVPFVNNLPFFLSGIRIPKKLKKQL